MLKTETIYFNKKEQEYFKSLLKDKELISSLRFYDSYRDCAVMSQWIMEACTKHKMALEDIEILLRTKECNSYLLGLPATSLPSHQKARNLLKGDGELVPYFLWICVNGEDESIQTLKLYGISKEQNLENLSQTGVICEDEEILL